MIVIQKDNMGKYIVKLSDKAEKDLKKIHQAGDKNSITRIERIFKELADNPYEGIGKPEALKYQTCCRLLHQRILFMK